MSAGSCTGKVRDTPESVQNNVGKDHRLDEVQGDGGRSTIADYQQ